MEQYKTCTKCGQIKSLNDYNKQSSAKDGKRSCCKICHSADSSAYAKRNKEKVNARIALWAKANPEKTKLYRAKARLKRVEKDAEYRRNYYLTHKVEKSEYWRAYRLANAEKLYLKGKNWRLANPDKVRNYASQRRARMRLVTTYEISHLEMSKLLKSDCSYCGQAAGTLDHIVPISRGGQHSIGNLAPACESCNKSKSNKTIMEWKKVRGW